MLFNLLTPLVPNSGTFYIHLCEYLPEKDLAKLLGSKSRASEILSGKRSLSLRQIKILYRKLDIPAEVLIQESDPVT